MRVVIEVDIGTWQNTGASRHPQIFLTRPAPRFGEAGTYGVGADGKPIYGPVWNIRATADSNTLVQICPLTGGRRGRGVLLLLGAALLDLWGKHRSYQLGVAGHTGCTAQTSTVSTVQVMLCRGYIYIYRAWYRVCEKLCTSDVVYLQRGPASALGQATAAS
jgi:hypothetical protein